MRFIFPGFYLAVKKSTHVKYGYDQHRSQKYFLKHIVVFY